LTYVPLVYGYVNYAVPRPDREALGFAEAPLGPSGRRGSILGGTGIALTRRAQPDRALLDHLRWLLSEDAQMGFIPRRNGQPSGRRAWASPTVNGAWGGFYAATAATTEAAWVRPRFDGYIAFQTAAAAIIRTGLAANDSSPAILSPLRDAWHHSRQAARATLSTKDKS
jgi:multiple sugar transport system substrate-binding protein